MLLKIWIFFSIANRPKSSPNLRYFHRNFPPRDFSIMTLLLTLISFKIFKFCTCSDLALVAKRSKYICNLRNKSRFCSRVPRIHVKCLFVWRFKRICSHVLIFKLGSTYITVTKVQEFFFKYEFDNFRTLILLQNWTKRSGYFNGIYESRFNLLL